MRDFLERLRPSGTPGAASLSGVPADRVAERSAELAAVFAELADLEAQAALIRREAVAEAERRKQAAAEQARALVDTARRDAQAEQRASAASARSRARADTEARMTAAEQEAATVAERARDRAPALLATVVSQARAELASMRTDLP